jgi:hypothetical protein
MLRTPAEKMKWLNDINKCIENQRQLVSSDIGRPAPIWLPDASCNSCRICSTVFSMFKRRHHCRKWYSVSFVYDLDFILRYRYP